MALGSDFDEQDENASEASAILTTRVRVFISIQSHCGAGGRPGLLLVFGHLLTLTLTLDDIPDVPVVEVARTEY